MDIFLCDIIDKEILKHETENKNNETPKEEILIKIQYLNSIKIKFQIFLKKIQVVY